MTISLKSDPVQKLAGTLLFPLMIISAVTSQQTTRLLLAVAHVTTALAVLAAIIVVVGACGTRRWPFLLVIATVVARALRAIGEAPFTGPYEVAVCLLFCLAGAVLAMRQPRLVYDQVVALCLISLPLMWLQLVGAGLWTEALRTDGTDVAQFPTLFRKAGAVTISVLQARPSGFFPSANLFSVVIVFAIGLHYPRANRPRVGWRDWLIGAVTVLSMSKIAYLAFGVIGGWIVIVGDSARRRRALQGLALLGALTGAYAVLFPGMFSYLAAPDFIKANFVVRFNDLLTAAKIPPEIVRPMQVPLSQTPSSLPEKPTAPAPARPPESRVAVPTMQSVREAASHPSERQSGYAVVADSLPYVLVLALALSPWFWRGFRRMRALAADWIYPTSVALMVALLLPLITSFLAGVLYWFMVGFAALPLLQTEPHFRAMLRRRVVPDVELRA